MRQDFLRYYHKSYGHWSASALEGIIGARGWWPSMTKDIKEFASTCPECQLAQRPRSRYEREAPQPLILQDFRPFEKWAIDFISQLLMTPYKNKWLIIAIDVATGWPLARAMPEATAEAVADFIYEEIYYNFDAPTEFLLNNRTNFTSEIVTHLITRLITRHHYMTSYHLRINRKVECFNKILEICLTKALMYHPTIE